MRIATAKNELKTIWAKSLAIKTVLLGAMTLIQFTTNAIQAKMMVAITNFFCRVTESIPVRRIAE
jgi:hypothetical protein